MRNLILASLFLVTACSRQVVTPRTITPTVQVKSVLAERRAQNIERLHAYRVAGRFPENLYSMKTVNVFRDAQGRLCAIANLIHQSGRDDLVDAQVRANNFIALRDIHDGPIMDWILESGLTQEEIVLVQGVGYEESFTLSIEDREGKIAAIQKRLEKAEQQLREDTGASLDVAVARLEGAGPAVASSALAVPPVLQATMTRTMRMGGFALQSNPVISMPSNTASAPVPSIVLAPSVQPAPRRP